MPVLECGSPAAGGAEVAALAEPALHLCAADPAGDDGPPEVVLVAASLAAVARAGERFDAVA
ncbi:hypothetical protein VM95_21375 [Streptomyces rubellomurinus]|uniref:Uncharacterized protein n=1 Tax=Streptomyces rubellomurinus (strain ATCC 31215) TaxID=359131 RepID=A0A0F2TD06_STRR3|nr:hypothetical protein VM95_21375 [Streptomyces rubellomurinus]